MAKMSAGLPVYREKEGQIQVFLVHPGGPFWEGRDEGSWSIPKGEYTDHEQPIDAAKREFKEETGLDVPEGRLIELRPIKQPSGKVVSVWAIRGDFDVTSISSNSFCMEWPPGSGNRQEFPEVDRAEWFGMKEARKKILRG